MRRCSPSCADASHSICPARSAISPRCWRSSGEKTGLNLTDHRKAGTKHHLITDAHGVPLVAIVTGAMRTMSRNCCRWSMRFPRSPTNVVPLAPALSGCWATVRMIRDRTGVHWPSVASNVDRHGGVGHTALAWARSAGSSSARSRGCISSAACVSDMKNGRTSMKRSCRRAAD